VHTESLQVGADSEDNNDENGQAIAIASAAAAAASHAVSTGVDNSCEVRLLDVRARVAVECGRARSAPRVLTLSLP